MTVTTNGTWNKSSTTTLNMEPSISPTFVLSEGLSRDAMSSMPSLSLDVRPIGMTDEKAVAANAAIAEHNQSLINKALAAGKPTNRLRLKHAVSSIIEFPTGNKTVEMIRASGLFGHFQTCIDMGPKHFAAFLRGEDYSIAILQPIFDKLKEYADELRILQRKLDRQRRASNPGNYNPNGTIRKGKRLRWKRSQGYIETNNRIKELHRLVRETRESAIRELSSIIAALSKKVSAEDLSYKSLAKELWPVSRELRALVFHERHIVQG